MAEKRQHPTSVAQFILRRLKEIGCDHVFGVPGDYLLGFLNEVTQSGIKYIGTCNELNAGYAADGYARLRGIGCLTVTYAVGELSAINAIAGAFAENVPVVILGGVPTTHCYRQKPMLHHTFGNYDAPLKMLQHVTAAQTVLHDRTVAAAEVDRVLTVCLGKRQPVYIGIPSDQVTAAISSPSDPLTLPRASSTDPDSVRDAVLDTLESLRHSRQPLLIPGNAIQRLGLQSVFSALLDASGVPFVTMVMSKGVVNEDHPQFIGVYGGDRSPKHVKDRVETSDCVVIFGEKMTDFNTGGFTAPFDDPQTTILVDVDTVRIGSRVYRGVSLEDYLRQLTARVFVMTKQPGWTPARHTFQHRPSEGGFVPTPDRSLTMARIFDRLVDAMQPNSVVIVDMGACFFSAAETLLPRNTRFFGQTYYASIGYSLGATLGACIAEPNTPVYLLIGDGSFQVTAQELSTLIRYDCRPLILLFNNDGYTIERIICDGTYNDIQPWKYHLLPPVFGGQQGYDCVTEGDFDTALREFQTNPSVTFVEVHIERWDCADTLKRAGRQMARSNEIARTTEQEKSPGGSRSGPPKEMA